MAQPMWSEASGSRRRCTTRWLWFRSAPASARGWGSTWAISSSPLNQHGTRSEARRLLSLGAAENLASVLNALIRTPADGVGRGFSGIGNADRLKRHESRRRTMAHVADHLSVSALEQQYRSCTDVTTARHFQTIWLRAKGHEIAEVAATVSFARR